MPDERTDLYLHEQILLLALRDDKGTIESRAGWYSLALGGGLLSELLLTGRIAIEEGDKPAVRITDDTRTGAPLLDECLALVPHMVAGGHHIGSCVQELVEDDFSDPEAAC